MENRPGGDGIVLGRKALMVRIRKNANLLTVDERDRFLRALATVNMTVGTYLPFQDIHAGGERLLLLGLPSGGQAQFLEENLPELSWRLNIELLPGQGVDSHLKILQLESPLLR